MTYPVPFFFLFFSHPIHLFLIQKKKKKIEAAVSLVTIAVTRGADLQNVQNALDCTSGG
jgi:hypothetical protein